MTPATRDAPELIIVDTAGGLLTFLGAALFTHPIKVMCLYFMSLSILVRHQQQIIEKPLNNHKAISLRQKKSQIKESEAFSAQNAWEFAFKYIDT